MAKPTTTTVRFEGGKELAAALQALPASVQGPVVYMALLESGEPMRAEIARLAPYEPGAPDLRANIVMNQTGRVGNVSGGSSRSATATEHVIAIGPAKEFFYGLFQEYGTVRHGAQPFMRPGFDTQSGRVVDTLGQRLWALIEAAAKRLRNQA
jgi:HK97 gp10 family phage protein